MASRPAAPPHLVPRVLTDVARTRLAGYPVLTITGPRQSGKTTLSRLLAPQLPYVSLEDPDTRAFALEDPRAFLRQLTDGAIIDEAQRAPQLFSYMQGVVDADRRMGRFILTGSSQFELMESITQSLAGRASMLTLLPFSLGELQRVGRAPHDRGRAAPRRAVPPDPRPPGGPFGLAPRLRGDVPRARRAADPQHPGPGHVSTLRAAVRRAHRAAGQRQLARRRHRHHARHCRGLALGPPSEPSGVPREAVVHEHQQASHQDSEAVLHGSRPRSVAAGGFGTRATWRRILSGELCSRTG